MKEFFKKIFQSKKQKDKQQPSAAADVQEIERKSMRSMEFSSI